MITVCIKNTKIVTRKKLYVKIRIKMSQAASLREVIYATVPNVN